MRYMILWSLLAMIVAMMIPGASQPSDKPAIINLMIDAQMPQMSFSATEEQTKEAQTKLENIYNQINDRGLVATIFAPQDAIRSNLDLALTHIGLKGKFELAMSGNNSNENISIMPYADQSASLKVSKMYVEGCNVCGKNNITVYGFMPQSFDQNQDTYKVLDDLGIQYDAGFQAGLLYIPGHEKDVWPYLVQGHKFYAVPVSTYDLSEEKVALRDSYFKDNGLGATQWYDALVGKFEEIQDKDAPMVISLTTSVSGSGDYLNALNRFMDYAASKEASFVTTAQLVEMAKANVHDVSALPINMTAFEGCPTCDQNEGNINATISVINDTHTLETINDSE